jgi:hypothetical protein
MLPDVAHFYVDKTEQIEAWHSLDIGALCVCVKDGVSLVVLRLNL